MFVRCFLKFCWLIKFEFCLRQTDCYKIVRVEDFPDAIMHGRRAREKAPREKAQRSHDIKSEVAHGQLDVESIRPTQNAHVKTYGTKIRQKYIKNLVMSVRSYQQSLMPI